MPQDAWMTQNEITDFEGFLRSKGIGPDDPAVPLLKEVWNQAVKSACDYFGNLEGTDHGAEKALSVP